MIKLKVLNNKVNRNLNIIINKNKKLYLNKIIN